MKQENRYLEKFWETWTVRKKDDLEAGEMWIWKVRKTRCFQSKSNLNVEKNLSRLWKREWSSSIIYSDTTNSLLILLMVRGLDKRTRKANLNKNRLSHLENIKLSMHTCKYSNIKETALSRREWLQLQDFFL